MAAETPENFHKKMYSQVVRAIEILAGEWQVGGEERDDASIFRTLLFWRILRLRAAGYGQGFDTVGTRPPKNYDQYAGIWYSASRAISLEGS